MIKRHENTPAHLFFDKAHYFITGTVYKSRPLISKPDMKYKLIEIIKKNFIRYEWELHHWVILDNHYHLIGKSSKGKDLSLIIRNIHRESRTLILNTVSCEKPIWWNYWDYCPRDENDYLTHLNYLLFNPVKHGYVQNLQDYPFSSFHMYMASKGRESLIWQFKQYPDYKNLILHND